MQSLPRIDSAGLSEARKLANKIGVPAEERPAQAMAKLVVSLAEFAEAAAKEIESLDREVSRLKSKN